MKKLIVALSLLGTAAAFAQTSYGPSDVCRRVSSWNSSNGATCAQAISRSRFDQAVVDVGYALANSGNTSAAVQVMQIGGGRRMDIETARVCTRVASWNATNAVACVEASLDAAFDTNALNVAYVLANAGNTSAAVTAVKNSRDAFMHPGAARVCERAAAWNATNGAACLAAIANKDYMNGTESVCYDLANAGNTSSAVTCLINSGIEYSPYPPLPTEVVMTSLQFNDIQRTVRKADMMLNRGNIEQARRALEDVKRLVDEVAAQNGNGRNGGGRRN